MQSAHYQESEAISEGKARALSGVGIELFEFSRGFRSGDILKVSLGNRLLVGVVRTCELGLNGYEIGVDLTGAVLDRDLESLILEVRIMLSCQCTVELAPELKQCDYCRGITPRSNQPR